MNVDARKQWDLRRIYMHCTCSGPGQHWVHLQRWLQSSVLCCLSVCCRKFDVFKPRSRAAAFFPPSSNGAIRPPRLTCGVRWRNLQPRARTPSPPAPPSPDTSAAAWRPRRPSPTRRTFNIYTARLMTSTFWGHIANVMIYKYMKSSLHGVAHPCVFRQHTCASLKIRCSVSSFTAFVVNAGEYEVVIILSCIWKKIDIKYQWTYYRCLQWFSFKLHKTYRTNRWKCKKMGKISLPETGQTLHILSSLGKTRHFALKLDRYRFKNPSCKGQIKSVFCWPISIIIIRWPICVFFQLWQNRKWLLEASPWNHWRKMTGSNCEPCYCWSD